VALPPTVPGPPNAVVQVQPGMNVQAACIITPPAGAVLVTTGAPANTSVAVQPGMAVRAIVLVNSAGQLVSY
jgi:hypothetical protein